MTVLSACRGRLIPACIISTAAIAALVAPGVASAKGVSKQACTGVAITGQGASVENVAQGLWTPAFNTSSDVYACSGTQGPAPHGTPKVTYDSTSSGAGLRSWGVEPKSPTEVVFGPTNAFVGTAEAPNSAQLKEIEAHESTPTASTVETIPVGQFALTIYVNLPTGCTATNTVSGAEGRLVLTDATLVGIYEGTITKWGQLKDGGDTLTPSTCDEDTITPVVRGESAGTTNVLKKFLNLIDPAAQETASGDETWVALSEGKLNTVWPKATAVVKTTKSGDSGEASLVASTPGSIGYSNLAELRALNEFSGSGNGAGTAKFWVELQNSVKGKAPKLKYTYADPASNGDAAAAASANCAKTKYSNGAGVAFPPENTLVPWNEVTSELKEKAYALCNFTYALAVTKYSLLSGATEAEAQTVQNYLSFVTDLAGGQKLLEGADYLGLPKGKVSKAAATGAQEIAY